MTSLKSQFKALKHEPALGGMSEAAFERVRARLKDAIGSEPTPQTQTMFFEYLRWHASQYVSRPVVAGAFSLVVVAGGWITTVRAADSLPGETLYSVKMISEKAQLKLASIDRRAELHTEFAGRRLQEASDLQEGALQSPENAALVRGAIEAYRQELSSAGENLRQLKEEGDETALATATSVQQSLQAIDTAIDQVVAESSSAETTQEALAAREVTSEVSEVATNVVVEVHEEQQSELSEYELKQMFRTELGQIEARQRFDLERLEVIRTALADESISYEGVVVPTSDELLAYEYPIVAVDSLLSQAMNYFAAGGFRSAFETLQEIDDTLLEIESGLAQIEITIMTARNQTAPETETEVTEPTEQIPEEVTPAEVETL